MVISVAENKTLHEERFPGKLEEGGKKIKYFSLSNGRLSALVTNYGARMLDLSFTRGGGKGQWEHILLKKDRLEDYINDDSELGSLAVSRWGGRITDGRYLDPVSGGWVDVDKNWIDDKHYLHGKLEDRWSKRIWDINKVGDDHLELGLVSLDGDFGFPGQVDVTLRMTITNDDEIVLDYKGNVSGKDTPVNIVEHVYFDLSGRNGAGDVGECTMKHNCPQYLVVNKETLLPTGTVRTVKGTYLDYLEEKGIGKNAVRIDNCLVGPQDEDTMLTYYHPGTDIGCETKTDQPCIVAYLAKHLGCNSACAEGQQPVDSMNHKKLVDRFGSPIVKVGDTYTQRTTFRFFNKKSA